MPGTICRLDRLAVISITGQDRISFLQGQLTNDVTKLGTGLMTAGWCSPKGRLITVMRLFAGGDAVYAVLPADLLEPVSRRLRMYVLRSRVKIEALAGIKAVGVLGGASEVPGRVFALPDGRNDSLESLGIEPGRSIAFIREDEVPPQASADDSPWWAAAACAGEPWVFAATRELFVPQGVNLELAGGVSFTKGCYTGQEIVSRVQHIGRPSRRGALFAAPGTADASPGGTLDGDRGTVVVSGRTAGGRLAVFAQVPVDLLGRPAAAGGVPLEPLALPYRQEA